MACIIMYGHVMLRGKGCSAALAAHIPQQVIISRSSTLAQGSMCVYGCVSVWVASPGRAASWRCTRGIWDAALAVAKLSIALS